MILGLVIGAVTLVALAGIEQSARLTVALSAIQVGGLAVIVVVGIPHIGEHNLIDGTSAPGVISAAALVFFAFVASRSSTSTSSTKAWVLRCNTELEMPTPTSPTTT
jgi:amino acid transporter